jgi:hypothetical protein
MDTDFATVENWTYQSLVHISSQINVYGSCKQFCNRQILGKRKTMKAQENCTGVKGALCRALMYVEHGY